MDGLGQTNLHTHTHGMCVTCMAADCRRIIKIKSKFVSRTNDTTEKQKSINTIEKRTSDASEMNKKKKKKRNNTKKQMVICVFPSQQQFDGSLSSGNDYFYFILLAVMLPRLLHHRPLYIRASCCCFDSTLCRVLGIHFIPVDPLMLFQLLLYYDVHDHDDNVFNFYFVYSRAYCWLSFHIYFLHLLRLRWLANSTWIVGTECSGWIRTTHRHTHKWYDARII